jgi:hypothetical protein
MQLTAQQLEQFAEEGYLFLPGCFSEREVAILRDEAERIYASDRQEVWREKTGRRAPPSPPILTTKRSAYWARIHG